MQSGNDWTLDLGTVTQGSSPAADGIRVLNNAAAGSDSLDGYLTVTGDGGVATSFSPSFLALQPGAAQNVINVQGNTSGAGTHTETVTFNLFGSNLTGFDAAIASQTLTITSEVTALAPVFTSPAAVTVIENVPTALDVSLAEPNSVDGETFTVTLTDASGILSATGTDVSGAGTANLSIEGTFQQVDAALGTLTYVAGSAGSDEISLQATDSFGNVASATIDVTVSLPTPMLTSPATVTVPIGHVTPVSGLSFQEPGSPAGATFTATLSDTNGDLSAPGPSVSGSGTSSLSVTGTLSQVNAALGSITVLEGNSAPDTIKLKVSDGGAEANASIAVSVVGRPALVVPASATVVGAIATSIAGLSLSEGGSTAAETFTVSLSDTSGLLAATGVGVSGSGTNNLTVTGSLAQVNASLATLRDDDNSLGTDPITLRAIDSFGNSAPEANVAVTVNQSPPVITVPATIHLQQAAQTLVAGITLAQVDDTSSEIFKVTVSDTNGILSATGAGVVGSGTPTIDLSGTLADINSQLVTLTDTDVVASDDALSFRVTNSLGGTASAKSAVTVTSLVPVLNMPVSLTAAGGSQPLRNVSLSESGSVSGETFAVTLMASSGFLSAHGSGVFGSGSHELVVTGTLDQVSADLATLEYVSTQSGTDQITAVAYDSLGNTSVTSTTAVACYCSGTMILTETGERPIEELTIGDRVVTWSGALIPIRWIGRRSYGGRFAARNPNVLPVLIRAGALAEGIPRRDLRVSPLHAMYIDGILIPAIDLVNGESIVHQTDVAEVNYFHIEFETHDVLIAEGAASESFVDDESRHMFHNAEEYWLLYPDAVQTEACYCAARMSNGYEVEAIRQRITALATLGSCRKELAA